MTRNRTRVPDSEISQQILQLIQEHQPVTVRELEQHLPISYHTIRNNYLYMLIEKDYIQSRPCLRDMREKEYLLREGLVL